LAAGESNATLPTALTMRAGLKQFNEAAQKAQQVFAKGMDAAAAAYMEHNDLANVQAVTDEKKRLLVHPNSIDLLALVDVSKDTIAGEWRCRKRVLTLVKPAEISIIQIPYEPGPEYNLHLTAERQEGRNYLAIGLVAGGRQCTHMFDGWPDSGSKSGLQLIDGKYVLDNGTAVTGPQLPAGKAVSVDVAVRKDSIAAWVKTADQAEKRQVVDYAGAQDRLGIETDFLKGIKNPNTLFLHIHTSRFVVSSIDFDPVGRSTGKAAR
jgi:hypothetical protein